MATEAPRVVVDGVRAFSDDEWLCFRWSWRLCGQRTGTPSARLIHAVWSEARGALTLDHAARAIFLEELEARRRVLDGQVRITASVEQKDVVRLVEKSGVRHVWEPSRGDAVVREGKKSVEAEPDTYGRLAAMAAMVDVLERGAELPQLSFSWS